MDVEELLQRYASGQREFREVDLSCEELIDVDLNGINLSYSDLTGTDVSGANPTGANLSKCIAITANEGRY